MLVVFVNMDTYQTRVTLVPTVILYMVSLFLKAKMYLIAITIRLSLGGPIRHCVTVRLVVKFTQNIYKLR